ncbi:MAG: hypothetical protein HYY06_03805 [Deltaproteobacteria bacterium]|nr:hypothetical protein [Deltaproteobacteria bacterium]
MNDRTLVLACTAFLLAACSSSAPPPPASDRGTPAAPVASPVASPADRAQTTPAVATPAAPVPTGVIGSEGIAAFDALDPAQIAALAKRRVFWGHQSVGANVLEGARALGFDFAEVSRGSDYARVAWGEAGVEENGDPERKIASFGAYLEDQGIGRRVEAAGFKFCWIDFEEDTDVADLLGDYEEKMGELARSHPRVRFLHVTPPLTTDEPEKNLVRWRYGREMIRRFANRGVVLDLASVISTGADGRACESRRARRLCPAWSSDNGHLNDEGSRRAAKAFLYAFFRLLS